MTLACCGADTVTAAGKGTKPDVSLVCFTGLNGFTGDFSRLQSTGCDTTVYLAGTYAPVPTYICRKESLGRSKCCDGETCQQNETSQQENRSAYLFHAYFPFFFALSSRIPTTDLAVCLLALIILSSVKPEMGEKRRLISEVSSGQNYSIIERTLCQYPGNGLERSKTGKMTKKSMKIIFRQAK